MIADGDFQVLFDNAFVFSASVVEAPTLGLPSRIALAVVLLLAGLAVLRLGR